MAPQFAQHISHSKHLDHIERSPAKPFAKQPRGRIECAFKSAYSKYWDWVREEKQVPAQKSTSKLQFFYEPVPGIYSCERGSEFRKLVYVKGNQKKDCEGLFRQLEGFNSQPKENTGDNLGSNESFIQLASEDFDNTTTPTNNEGEDIIDPVCGSNESFTIDEVFEYNSKKSTRFHGLLDVVISPSDNLWLPVLPLESQSPSLVSKSQLGWQNSISQASTGHTSWSASNISSRNTSPMTSTNPSMSNLSVFSNFSAASSATSLSSTSSTTSKPAKPIQIQPNTTTWKPKPLHTTQVCKKSSRSKGITAIDLAGYRKLLRPLLVEYQPVVGRWMFSSEIEFRTTEKKIIKPSTPRYAQHPVYQGGKNYRLFALDDGESWVVTGKWVEERFYERKVTMSDVQRGNKKGALFSCMEGGKMRMQGREEREGSLERIGREKEAFLIDDEWVMDFEAVVRFLDVA